MNDPDPYAARHGFVAPAKGRVTFLGLIGCTVAIELAWLFSGPIFLPFTYEDAGTPWRTFAVHLLFLSMTLPTFLLVMQVQKRSPATLFGPRDVVFSDMKSTAKAMFVLYAALQIGLGMDLSTVEQNMPKLTWVLLLPFACLAVLIQTSAEEIVYRGFLQQSLGALSDNRLVWMLLPSILFGLSHYNGTIPFNATAQHMIWATFFGLAAADLTARTGTLGAAMGLHFAYNLPLMVLYTEPGLMSGFGLMVLESRWTENDPDTISLLVDLFYLWMIWMACRIGIRA